MEAVATKTIPTSKGWPFIGHLPDIRREDFLNFVIKQWQTYGDVTSYTVGPVTMLLFSHPDHAHHILVKNPLNYQKGSGYDRLRLLMGNGLVTSEYETWRGQRRIMQPSFTPKNTLGFTQSMVNVTAKMLERWRPLAEKGTEFDLATEMMRLTMSIIGEAMFSLDLSTDEHQAIGRAFGETFDYVGRAASSLFVPPLSWPTPGNMRFKHALDTVNQFITERIAHGRKNPQQHNLLSMLIQATDEETNAQMNEQQLRDEVVTLFFAGFETTARTLAWTYYNLTQNPAAYAKLHAEVDEVLKGQLPTVETLYQLKYVRMVADETLRLYPPTGILARQTIADDVIDGYKVPAGSLVAFSPHILHRHPEFWTDPEAFIPERFAPEKTETMHKCAYMPFSTGPRICLGNNFALLEIVLVLAMVAQRYELKYPQKQVDVLLRGTSKPKEDLVMKLALR